MFVYDPHSTYHALRHAPHTALYMDGGGVFHEAEEGPGSASYVEEGSNTADVASFWDEGAVLDGFERRRKGPTTTVSQRVVRDLLLNQYVLRRRLGQGGFGTIFVCEHDGNNNNNNNYSNNAPTSTTGGNASTRLVVKLPSEVLNRNLSNGVSIGQALMAKSDHNASKFAKAQAEFRDECHNAEQILEPPLMHVLRARHGGGGRDEGTPMQHLPAEEYAALMAERAHWQALPGYAHLHALVHFEASVPMLLSVRAEGSLEDLRRAVVGEGSVGGSAPLDLWTSSTTRALVSPLWVTLARQIASAVQFIDTYTELAHLDLKPQNVLFRFVNPDVEGLARFAPNNVHCLVADFGVCAPKEASADGSLPCTPFYNPSEARWSDDYAAQRVTHRALSFFQYFATVLDLLRMPTVARQSQGQGVQRRIEWLYPTDSRGNACLADLVYGGLRTPSASGFRFLKPAYEWARSHAHPEHTALVAALEAMCISNSQELPLLFEEAYGVLMSTETERPSRI